MEPVSDTVSVVVVNYNGEAFLQECLQSVLDQSRSPDQILVVDNASTDQSLALLQTSFPDIPLLALGENLGYAGACNRGIEETTGELIAILNNDLVLDSSWLECLLKENSPAWDFWASRILFASDPSRVDSAGDGMAVVGSGFKIGHGDLANRHDAAREVFGACGAAALYRRSLLEAVGGFDPDFFLIYEDADLNFRARLLGFRCRYVPDAVVLHRVNASIGSLSRTYVFFGHRNSEYVFWKNMPTRLLWSFMPERLLFNLLSLLFFLSRGKGGAFLRGKIDFIRKFPAIMKKRRQIQASRKVSTAVFRNQLDRNWLKYRRGVKL